MRATGFNHVSIHARNLEESTGFYVEFLGMERPPRLGRVLVWRAAELRWDRCRTCFAARYDHDFDEVDE